VRNGLLLLELLLLGEAGCRRADRTPPGPIAASVSSLSRVALPRVAGRFSCEGELCRQAAPRLPDTGEWRCADRDGVVWCAGGEPAAGVVSGPPDPRFRCGPRWGKAALERVCLDEQPDLPAVAGAGYRCRFEQEQGVTRVCQVAANWAKPRALPNGSLAACWLDADCPSGMCDRGACGCRTDRDCERGTCRDEHCVEGAR
jgi:hypothetical protein